MVIYQSSLLLCLNLFQSLSHVCVCLHISACCMCLGTIEISGGGQGIITESCWCVLDVFFMMTHASLFLSSRPVTLLAYCPLLHTSILSSNILTWNLYNKNKASCTSWPSSPLWLTECSKYHLDDAVITAVEAVILIWACHASLL